MGWQRHQLYQMQTIYTSLQTDNHASTSPLRFYRPDALPGAKPRVSKQWRHNYSYCKDGNNVPYTVAVLTFDGILEGDLGCSSGSCSRGTHHWPGISTTSATLFCLSTSIRRKSPSVSDRTAICRQPSTTVHHDHFPEYTEISWLFQ